MLSNFLPKNLSKKQFPIRIHSSPEWQNSGQQLACKRICAAVENFAIRPESHMRDFRLCRSALQ